MTWRRGLIVVISDLIDDPDRVLTGLKHFRHRQHEVLVFHVLDPARDRSGVRQRGPFRGSRGRGRSDPHAALARARELSRAGSRSGATVSRRECGQHRIDYVPLSTETPFDVALLAYLNKRARMR